MPVSFWPAPLSAWPYGVPSAWRLAPAGSGWLWLALAAASLYLCVDELAGFHEHRGLYLTFLREQMHLPLSDYGRLGRLKLPHYSDMILISYGLAALWAAFKLRKQLFATARSTLFFAAGAGLLFLSLAIDTNMLHRLVPALDLHGPNIHLLEAWEESFKLTGFSAIVSGLISLYVNQPRPAAPGSNPEAAAGQPGAGQEPEPEKKTAGPG